MSLGGNKNILWHVGKKETRHWSLTILLHCCWTFHWKKNIIYWSLNIHDLFPLVEIRITWCVKCLARLLLLLCCCCYYWISRPMEITQNWILLPVIAAASACQFLLVFLSWFIFGKLMCSVRLSDLIMT